MEVKVLRKSNELTSKMDNTFVYNIVAKCIVPFNSLLIFTYRYNLFFKSAERFLLLK